MVAPCSYTPEAFKIHFDTNESDKIILYHFHLCQNNGLVMYNEDEHLNFTIRNWDIKNCIISRKYYFTEVF